MSEIERKRERVEGRGKERIHLEPWEIGYHSFRSEEFDSHLEPYIYELGP